MVNHVAVVDELVEPFVAVAGVPNNAATFLTLRRSAISLSWWSTVACETSVPFTAYGDGAARRRRDGGDGHPGDDARRSP